MLTSALFARPGPRRDVARPQRGFTLVEIVIAITIMAFLVMMGVPAFSTYLQNAKVRAAAEDFLAGVQTARAEAVRRNTSVEFVLTSDYPNASAVGTTNLSPDAPNWLVRVQDPTTLAYTFIEGKAGFEGSGERAGSTPTTQIAGTVSSITFNGFGRANTAATFNFSSPVGGACAPSGSIHCLRVVVSLGGQARLCDPSVTAAGDTRAC